MEVHPVGRNCLTRVPHVHRPHGMQTVLHQALLDKLPVPALQMNLERCRSQPHFARGVDRLEVRYEEEKSRGWLQCLRMARWFPCEVAITPTQRPLGEQTQATREDAEFPSFEPLFRGRHPQAGTWMPAPTQSNSEQLLLCSTAFIQKHRGFPAHSGSHRKAGSRLVCSCDLCLPCWPVLCGNSLAEHWAKDKQAGLNRELMSSCCSVKNRVSLKAESKEFGFVIA